MVPFWGWGLHGEVLIPCPSPSTNIQEMRSYMPLFARINGKLYCYNGRLYEITEDGEIINELPTEG
jgi:hypothetical protein